MSSLSVRKNSFHVLVFTLLCVDLKFLNQAPGGDEVLLLVGVKQGKFG